MANKPLKTIKFPGLNDVYTIPQPDASLTDNNKYAPAGVVGTELDELDAKIDEIGELTEDVKVALLQCFRNVAWINEHGQDYYEALYNALYPNTGLLRIEATFTQGSTIINTETPLNNLKAYLTVTGYYNNGTAKRIRDYALSGQLVEGTSTITASVGTLTATFTVNVTSSERYEFKLSDDTLSPLVVGGISTVDGIPTISRKSWSSSTQEFIDSPRRVINVSYGVKPFNIRETSQETSEIQVSPYFPIPIPSDATEATITVTPATLSVNGTIRKYENGIFTIVEEAITEVGSISFTFEADDSLYFVGQVRDITDTEPTEVVVTFTAPVPVQYTYKLSDGDIDLTQKRGITTIDGLANIYQYVTSQTSTVEQNNSVISIDEGEQPFIERVDRTDTEYTVTTKYPIPVPADATSATITVTPATLVANGNIRKFTNGAYTIVAETQNGTGEIQFSFTADEHLYFVGQIKDADIADISEIEIVFE